jgi:hypothetical protein
VRNNDGARLAKFFDDHSFAPLGAPKHF